MKTMLKKTIATLLIVLTVAGFLPVTVLAADGCSHEKIEETLAGNGNGTHTAVNTCKDCGEVILPEVSNETAMIKVDLKQFAKDASEQEWWSGLRQAVDENTKFVGNPALPATMADYEEAYTAMREYLSENECWNIDEDISDFVGGYKRLYFNPTDSVPWGITMYTYYQGGANADRGRLAFTVNAEKAGTYDLSMDVFKEYSSYSARQSLTGDYPGGAHVDILVNGELVKQDFSFEDKQNIRLTEYVASVELDEGENSIVIRPLHSYNGPNKLEGGRFNIAINSMVFVMAPQPVMAEGESLTVDPKAYVAFGDNNITAQTHTVTSSAEDVATVSFDENDELVINALQNGIAYITVKKGSEETCKITVTVGDTEFCEDAEEDGVCDICKDKFAECKHKKTTVVKTPNGDETTTTTETCDYCGTIVRQVTRSDKNIIIDFKEFAKDISKQSWWNDLIPAANADTKYVGSASTSAWMTAEQEAAYNSMLAHLEANYQWTIDESITNLANARYWKRLFINCSDSVPYGLCYFPIYHNDLPDRSKLAFTIKVPEGKAGFYHFDLSVFKENSSYPSGSITGTYGGGGKADIWVNDKLVYDEYSFEAANQKFTESMGAVYLNEGDNSVVIQSTVSYNGTINAGRCNLDFCSMQFIPLEPVKVQEYLSNSVVLRETYLTYNASIEGFTVKSSNEWIATAELTAAGNVNISGVTQGEAEIYVMNGSDVVCTIPVIVEAFEGTLDELKGSPAKVDFMAVMDKAVEEDWWNDLTDAEEADVKEVTLEDEALLNWLDANTRWNITAIDGIVTANGGAAKYGLGVDGKTEITVDLPASGLYNVTVEYLRGGDTVDVSVNEETLCAGLDTVGEAAVVKRSLGTAVLNKGANVFTFDAEGPVYLRAVIVTPLGSWQTEVGGERYINLNETYLPYDVEVDGNYTAVSANTGIVKAAFDADSELILTGVSEGVGKVTVTGPDGFSAVLTADVIEAGTFKEIVYTIDGFKAETLAVGEVADGQITGLTTKGTPMTDKQLRKYGSIYLVSSDKNVATVDQTTGDVTCVAEGSAVISAYILIDGITARADATICVTDDTDLSSIEVDSSFDYVAVSNVMQMTVSGLKSSGAAANMSLYPVTWSVDDETVAIISEDGKLTGLKPGTVTVTATAGVMRMPIADSAEILVVENDAIGSNRIMIDFTDGRAAQAQTATVDVDGYEINRDLTTDAAKNVKFVEKYGISQSVAVGDILAIDVFVPASGWYTAELRGALFSGGGIADIFVDDMYLGIMDFCEGRNGVQYDGGGERNTVWLDAGIHTLRLECTTKGTYYLGKVILHASSEPNEMKLTLSGADTMLVGQSAEASVSVQTAIARGNFTVKNVSETPDYTNYYILSSSAPNVVSVSGSTLTAVSAGTATITAACEINYEETFCTMDVTVVEGTIISAELTAENTTVKPDAGSVQLTLAALGADGAVELPEGVEVTYTSEDAAIATVNETGLVTIKGEEGSVRIVAVINEGGREIEAEIWITVTAGKTAPTLFTYEERANAQENVLKYSWAWEEKETAISMADFVVEHLDQFYDLYFHDVFPRSVQVGWLNDPMAYYCRYCNTYLATNYSVYPWRVDVINNPWKITCPACNRVFPSNDFGAFYESGLDEHGNFSYDLADKSLLVNELYPEMGEGWGVDDGKGYFATNASGATENHCYIAYYMQTIYCDFSAQSKTTQYGMTTIMDALQRAYLYTGDEKYGSAGAILINRLADIYPGYSIQNYSTDYALTDGNSYLGKFIGSIWEATDITQVLAQAADAFWPAMDNPDVIEYLRARKAKEGMDSELITPEWIRSNVDTGILLEIKEACETANAYGNFGMHQAAMTYAAVALDRLPETAEMIDWVFRYGERVGSGSSVKNTGGSVLYNIVDLVDRDGFGNEGSAMYNALWYTNLMEVADALSGYTRVEGADLWANPKFVNMVGAMMKLTCCGTITPSWGESGSVQVKKSQMDVDSMLTGFINSGNRDLAVSIYAANGNTTEGIHGSIFTKDPEGGLRAQIQQIVREDGMYDFSESNMMGGLGLAILREGPATLLRGSNEDQFSDYWMQFGITGGTHSNLDSLNIGLDAFGLELSPDLGYPTTVTTGDPERMQWVTSTASNNTVLVNDEAQSKVSINSFPLHFDDAGMVKLIDAEAPGAYADADIYRRTLISVDNGDGVSYAVDFFRILGGSEHVYSFHAASTIDPKVEGLDMVHQAMGTYAGPNIPFGFYQSNPNTTDAAANIGNGYSWLNDVYRDDTPENTFSIDWAIEDFHHRLATSNGIRLKLTMLSEEPMAEVALANGRTPQNTTNPSYLEYAMIRKSGESDMDTLFTSVIEPYQFNSYIESSELVEVELVEGTEGVTDKAAAIKVTLKSGREDYIVYATNTDCVYEVAGKFLFQGFAGVVSYTDGKLTYAYGNEAKQVAGIVENDMPAITGTVKNFTKELADNYYMTIETDQSVTAEDFEGRYIYVNNDKAENGAYRIYGAEVKGNTVVLDLYTQDLIRNYVDATDLDSGFIYNIAEGQTFTIPMAASFDVEDLFTYTTDQVVKAGAKFSLTTGVSGAGYTYEAEGLPSGAKFNSSTGTITWTTSRTQTGRYPVTVKAIDAEGDVLATMSFNIYVVSYTGSAYAADVCAHSKAVTYEVDGMIETVCPACGTITKTAVEEEPATQKFDMAGSNMTLGNELKMNYLVETSKLGDGTYTARITHGDTVVEETFRKYSSVYSCVSYILNASQMADTITVEVFDEDGNAVSNVYTTSVRTYVMNVLQKSTTAAKSKTLMVDMLNYGAAAQEYFSYNTADLANSVLTEAQKACATGEVICTDQSKKGENYFGSNLSLNEKILLNLYFKNVTSDMYAEITFTDFYGVAHAIEVPFEEFRQYSGSTYAVIVDDIVLADCFVPVTVTVYNADGSVHGSATDSVESYCARKNADGSNALYSSIMKFATSAQAYFS